MTEDGLVMWDLGRKSLLLRDMGRGGAIWVSISSFVILVSDEEGREKERGLGGLAGWVSTTITHNLQLLYAGYGAMDDCVSRIMCDVAAMRSQPGTSNRAFLSDILADLHLFVSLFPLLSPSSSSPLFKSQGYSYRIS